MSLETFGPCLRFFSFPSCTSFFLCNDLTESFSFIVNLRKIHPSIHPTSTIPPSWCIQGVEGLLEPIPTTPLTSCQVIAGPNRKTHHAHCCDTHWRCSAPMLPHMLILKENMSVNWNMGLGWQWIVWAALSLAGLGALWHFPYMPDVWAGKGHRLHGWLR